LVLPASDAADVDAGALVTVDERTVVLTLVSVTVIVTAGMLDELTDIGVEVLARPSVV
jgi:hypothetical protein